MSKRIDEDELDRAIARLRTVGPTDAPLGDSQSIVEAIMNQETTLTATPTSGADVATQPTRRRARGWGVAAAGVAAVSALAASAVLNGGTNPPAASAAVGAAADATAKVTALHTTISVTGSSGGSSAATLDLNGTDYHLVSTAGNGGREERGELIYVDGALFERAGNDDAWTSHGPDAEDFTPFDEASAQLVRAAIDGGIVERIGEDGDTVLYRVSIDDQLIQRLADLPIGVQAWFELESVSSLPESEWGLDELTIGVDQTSGIVSRVHLATKGGTVAEIESIVPDRPEVIEAPTDVEPADVPAAKVQPSKG